MWFLRLTQEKSLTKRSQVVLKSGKLVIESNKGLIEKQCVFNLFDCWVWETANHCCDRIISNKNTNLLLFTNNYKQFLDLSVEANALTQLVTHLLETDLSEVNE